MDYTIVITQCSLHRVSIEQYALLFGPEPHGMVSIRSQDHNNNNIAIIIIYCYYFPYATSGGFNNPNDPHNRILYT